MKRADHGAAKTAARTTHIHSGFDPGDRRQPATRPPATASGRYRYGRRPGPAGLAPSGPRTGSYAARRVSGKPRMRQVDVAARPIWDLGGRRRDPAGFAGIVRRTICWPGPVFGLWGRATVAGWKPGVHEHVFRSRPSGRSGAELPARARRPAGL